MYDAETESEEARGLQRDVVAGKAEGSGPHVINSYRTPAAAACGCDMYCRRTALLGFLGRPARVISPRPNPNPNPSSAALGGRPRESVVVHGL